VRKCLLLSHLCLGFALYSRSASIIGSYTVKSDSGLVKAVLNGDRQAFAVLVKRYERPVKAVALHVVGTYHAAADVSQEAFIRAYEQLARLRRADAFGPWLIKITYRCALDHARRGPKEASLETRLSPADDSNDGKLDEQKQWVLAAVVRLPKSEKQVVMLRYFAGHNVKEVANMVGRSVGTVTKQLSRAHKRLRRILEEPGDDRS
jgi:RNA polymerase sigma-70 factor (ECF subfamily)